MYSIRIVMVSMMCSLDPPLREPDIKRTDLAQPPGGLRDGRFQVETAHLPLQNVIFALFRGPGWLREQSTSESSVLLMVGRNCSLPQLAVSPARFMRFSELYVYTIARPARHINPHYAGPWQTRTRALSQLQHVHI